MVSFGCFRFSMDSSRAVTHAAEATRRNSERRRIQFRRYMPGNCVPNGCLLYEQHWSWTCWFVISTELFYQKIQKYLSLMTPMPIMAIVSVLQEHSPFVFKSYPKQIDLQQKRFIITKWGFFGFLCIGCLQPFSSCWLSTCMWHLQFVFFFPIKYFIGLII